MQCGSKEAVEEERPHQSDENLKRAGGEESVYEVSGGAKQKEGKEVLHSCLGPSRMSLFGCKALRDLQKVAVSYALNRLWV